MKCCIFCKKDLAQANRAKEHIVPDWLLKEWRLNDSMLAPTHFDSEGNVLSSRYHNLGSMLSGNVCASCNNGWMSDLEARCKSMILELAGGKRRVLDISDTEALLLARWTVKTCYSLHAASNYRPIVPDSHFSVLDQDNYRLPEGVHVVGHCYKSGKDFSWSQTTSWEGFVAAGEIQKQDLQTLSESGYKIALKLGGLFLMVFFNPLPHARECLWFGRHIPLYPRWSHPVTWRKEDRAWPTGALVRFHYFVHALGVTFGADNPTGALAGGKTVRFRTQSEIFNPNGEPRSPSL
jgi:hypothetical protein